MESRTVGVVVLLADGFNVIGFEGLADGFCLEGCLVGRLEGRLVGDLVGRLEGLEVGFCLEGCLVGRLEGRLVGDLVCTPMTVVEQNVA